MLDGLNEEQCWAQVNNLALTYVNTFEKHSNGQRIIRDVIEYLNLRDLNGQYKKKGRDILLSEMHRIWFWISFCLTYYREFDDAPPPREETVEDLVI